MATLSTSSVDKNGAILLWIRPSSDQISHQFTVANFFEHKTKGGYYIRWRIQSICSIPNRKDLFQTRIHKCPNSASPITGCSYKTVASPLGDCSSIQAQRPRLYIRAVWNVVSIKISFSRKWWPIRYSSPCGHDPVLESIHTCVYPEASVNPWIWYTWR